MSTQWDRDPQGVRNAGAKYRTTEKYKETMRHNRYMRIYGLSLEDYNSKLKSQNYVCKICNCPETSIGFGGTIKSLAVDHCHDTGKVRGLLCDRCNHILGRARDSISLLENASKYLKEYS